jgi:hypothetical protein
MTVMITTIDNPYDPRTDFGPWYAWDVSHGYNTCAYIDRVLAETDDFPPEYNDRLAEFAIDEILAIHVNGIYKKLNDIAA